MCPQGAFRIIASHLIHTLDVPQDNFQILAHPMPGHSQRVQVRKTPNRKAQPVHAVGLLRAGCLEMHYQPILDLVSNRIGKVEALARLRDDDRLVPPGEFLPQFGNEALYELFVLGLDVALRDRNHWLMHGVQVDLSLNLPPAGLVDHRYFDATCRALARHGCPPSALTLELLEGRDIGSTACAAEQFRRFSALGVLLAEDDLGSGHSSLRRLRELAFDWIKIDRGVVQRTDHNNVEVLQFVYQLTRLGHGLGKSVIVEGVEDPDLVEAVRILGADAVQGYGIARPMPVHGILESLRAQTRLAIGTGSASALSRLARLLLAEENLHACQRHTLKATARPTVPARFVDTCDGGSEIAVAQACDACQRERFQADVDAIYPANPAHTDSKRALVHAAMHHGVHSPAYRQARLHLAHTT